MCYVRNLVDTVSRHVAEGIKSIMGPLRLIRRYKVNYISCEIIAVIVWRQLKLKFFVISVKFYYYWICSFVYECSKIKNIDEMKTWSELLQKPINFPEALIFYLNKCSIWWLNCISVSKSSILQKTKMCKNLSKNLNSIQIE